MRSSSTDKRKDKTIEVRKKVIKRHMVSLKSDLGLQSHSLQTTGYSLKDSDTQVAEDLIECISET